MGKSVSTSLEDDDNDLIRTTPGLTPSGPKFSLQPHTKPAPMYRQHSTQEHPPSSIFKPNPVILASGFLRDISYYWIKIPNPICIICSKYFSKKYKSLTLDANILHFKCLIISRIDDYSFNNISMGHDTSILGQTPIIKLSSTENLKMDWNSFITIDTKTLLNKNGTIILTVFGDINMGKNTKLLCGQHGNIYIQCNNLIMRSGSIISTTDNENTNDYNVNLSKSKSKSDLKRFGNIYMNIKESLIMDKMTNIKTGNIKIICAQAKIGMKSSIKALRKNAEIYSKNGIICDGNLNEIIYAKKQKIIDNKNEFNNDIIKIKETIKENIGYKLTMFEGGSEEEFECCICWNNEPNIMIKPCGHSTFCEPCMKELNPTECPICRITIKETKKF